MYKINILAKMGHGVKESAKIDEEIMEDSLDFVVRDLESMMNMSWWTEIESSLTYFPVALI